LFKVLSNIITKWFHPNLFELKLVLKIINKLVLYWVKFTAARSPVLHRRLQFSNSISGFRSTYFNISSIGVSGFLILNFNITSMEVPELLKEKTEDLRSFPSTNLAPVVKFQLFYTKENCTF
jgi:hypothetical protein